MSATERTPLPPDYTPGQGARELELSGGSPGLAQMLDELTSRVTSNPHTDEATADVSIVLDWAAELRTREGLTWPDALHAAATFYYG